MERVVLMILFGSVLSSCSVLDSHRCRKLQAKGLVQGTLDSCTKCIGQFGSYNVDAVNGCTIGMDAANLFGSVNRNTR